MKRIFSLLLLFTVGLVACTSPELPDITDASRQFENLEALHVAAQSETTWPFPQFYILTDSNPDFSLDTIGLVSPDELQVTYEGANLSFNILQTKATEPAQTWENLKKQHPTGKAKNFGNYLFFQVNDTSTSQIHLIHNGFFLSIILPPNSDDELVREILASLELYTLP